MDKESHSKTQPETTENDLDYVAVKLSKFEFISVFVSFALAVLLVALDATIVSTAIPKIAQEFGAFDLVAWIGIGFLLTSTAFSPTYGELCNTFGRKSVFLFAIIVFEIGSMLCAIASSMEFLIAGRVVAGVGGGGIFSCVLIMISDITSLRESGKYQGVLGAIFGLSSVIGPLIGGVFTDQLTWRWCFWINLPVGGIATIVVAIFLKFPPPEGSVKEKLNRIDYWGTFFAVAATTCFLLPLQLGGLKWEWAEAKTIILFVASAVLSIVFVVVESKARFPIIPPRFFTNVTVALNLLIAFLLGNIFIALFFYVPSFFQLVMAESATNSGLQSIPMIFGLVITSITSGIVISKNGRYKYWFYLGAVFLAAGLYFVSTMNSSTSKALAYLYLFASGLGVGCIIQTRIYAVQAAVDREDIASVTSASNFFLNLGGTIGLAVAGTIYNNSLTDKLGKELAGVVQANPALIAQLPNPEKIIDAIASSLGRSYFYGISMAGLLFIVAIFVRETRNANLGQEVALHMA